MVSEAGRLLLDVRSVHRVSHALRELREEGREREGIPGYPCARYVWVSLSPRPGTAIDAT